MSATQSVIMMGIASFLLYLIILFIFIYLFYSNLFILIIFVNDFVTLYSNRQDSSSSSPRSRIPNSS
jgi:hypothetical protein